MSIIRTFHNREKPYVVLNKATLWDNDLSLDTIALWARIISRPDGWQIYTSELCKSCRTGRDKMYRMIKELIDFGYAARWQSAGSDGRYGQVNYAFFEEKKTKEQIKEMFTITGFQEPLPENPDTAKPDPANGTLLSTDLKKVSKEKNKSAASADASALSSLLLNSIKDLNPEFKEPDLNSWSSEIDKMIRIDKREAENIRKMISWISKDLFWQKNILSAAKLRKQYDQIWMKMNLPSNKAEANRSLAMDLKKEVPRASHLQIKGDHVLDERLGKDLMFTNPNFDKILMGWYNVSYVDE